MNFEYADEMRNSSVIESMLEEFKNLPVRCNTVLDDYSLGIQTLVYDDGKREKRAIPGMKIRKIADKKAPAQAIKKGTAPVVRKNSTSSLRMKASAVFASFRDTMEKTESDLIRLSHQLQQLDSDIRLMGAVGNPQASPVLLRKKKEREETLRKIEVLNGIRDRCRKQLGMK